MEMIANSAHVLVIFALGVLATLMYQNQRVRDYFTSLDEMAYAYLALGVGTFLATLAVGMWGLIGVVVVVVLYQIFGKGRIPIPGLKTTDPNEGRQSAIDDIIVHLIDQRDDDGGANKRMIVEAVEDHSELLIIFDPKPSAEDYVTGALTRLIAAGKVDADGDGKYFASEQKITEIQSQLRVPAGGGTPIPIGDNDEGEQS